MRSSLEEPSLVLVTGCVMMPHPLTDPAAGCLGGWGDRTQGVSSAGLTWDCEPRSGAEAARQRAGGQGRLDNIGSAQLRDGAVEGERHRAHGLRGARQDGVAHRHRAAELRFRIDLHAPGRCTALNCC